MQRARLSLYERLLRLDSIPPPNAALAQLKGDVDAQALQIRRAWYSIGLLYNRAVQNESWTGSAYTSIDAYWVNNITSVTIHEARRYAKVAKVYDSFILAYGIAEVDLYMTWARLKHIKLGEDPGPQLVTWTIDGVDHQKPFAKCSQKDLRNAIATLHHRPGHGAPAPSGKAPLSGLLQACMAYVMPHVEEILADDPTHDFHAWVDTDVDEEGKEEVLLRANAFVFFDACMKIGELAKEFFAKTGPDGKPRKPTVRATRRTVRRRAR